MEKGPTDKELIDQFRDPRSRNMAFNTLVNRYQSRLYWHIRRMVVDHDDADDILQDTFVKAFRGLEHFRSDSQLGTWLYRIASNEAINFLRKKRLSLFIRFEDAQEYLFTKAESSTPLQGDGIVAKLNKAILTLPDKQRLVFNLRYYDNMPYEEMSAMLGTSMGALKASYHHAVKKIEKYMTKD